MDTDPTTGRAGLDVAVPVPAVVSPTTNRAVAANTTLTKTRRSNIVEAVLQSARAAAHVTGRKDRRLNAMAAGIARLPRRARCNFAGFADLTTRAAGRLACWVLELLRATTSDLLPRVLVVAMMSDSLKQSAVRRGLDALARLGIQSAGYGTCTHTTGPPTIAARAA